MCLVCQCLGMMLSGKAEGGEALNICFDVEASEHGSGDDEDMWEDVGTDPAPEDNTHGTEPRTNISRLQVAG
jgi:hypothetical protein